MRVASALSELWPAGQFTQMDVAQRLTEAGMPTDQTKVSAWLRGRVPNLEQLNVIEATFGVPRGWVLLRSGFIDLDALVAATSLSAADDAQLEKIVQGDGQRWLRAADAPDKGLPKKQVGERTVRRPRPPVGHDE